MKSSFRTILSITGAAALLLVLFLRFDRVRTYAATIAELKTERDALQRQLAAATGRMHVRERGAASLAPAPSAGLQPASGDRETAPEAGGRFAMLEFTTSASAMLADLRPEAMSAQIKAHLRRRYGPLFLRPGFPRERADEFISLLLEKQTTASDIVDVARAQGIGFDAGGQSSLQPMRQSAEAAIEDRAREILGEDGYRHYRHFEETMPHRATVEQLAGRLALASEPLSSTQSGQLLDILAAHAPRVAPASMMAGEPMIAVGMATPFGGEGTIVTSGAVNLMNDAPITDGALDRARSILTADQLAALQQLRSEREAAQRAFETMQKNIPPPQNGPHPERR